MTTEKQNHSRGSMTYDPVSRLPGTRQIASELNRVKYRKSFSHVVLVTIFTLVIVAAVAAVAVLLATLWLPVLQIYGSSMEPCLTEGDIVVSVKGSEFERGDLIAFYYNNKILVKRVIGRAGEWVDMDEDGTVYVNSRKLEEPYLIDKAYGTCDLDFPYQVPEGRIFVMGDNRSVSLDSRCSVVGCVSEELIVGKLILIVWPFSVFGRIA